MRVKYSFSSRRTGRIEGGNKHRKPYPVVVMGVISLSDIVLEVLDARFIEETRNKEIEEFILKHGKKIIYVLNKADLIDVTKVKKSVELHQMHPYVFVSCKNRHGISELRRRIKMEVKRIDSGYKRAQVGVIGYPNTGKSSVINMLVGRSAARTSAESGFTKGMQKVRMTGEIQIIDTPGVIPEKETEPGKRHLIKHTQIGVRTWDKVKDPDIIIFELIKKYPDMFKNYYGVDCQGNFEMLIESFGRKMNFIRKGNLVDIDKTARRILRDWQDGMIKKGQ